MEAVYYGVQSALRDLNYHEGVISGVRVDHFRKALHGKGTVTRNRDSDHGDNQFMSYTFADLDEWLHTIRSGWDKVYGSAGQVFDVKFDRGGRVELRAIASFKHLKGYHMVNGEKVKLPGLWQEELHVKVICGTPTVEDNDRFTGWMDRGAKADDLDR